MDSTTRNSLSSSIEIDVSDTQAYVAVDPSRVRDCVISVLGSAGRSKARISIALIDDASIHALNREYLNHDWPTDVVTFPLSSAAESTLNGEVVVSAETAIRAAAAHATTPEQELLRYVIHGVLHLCGYDDLSESDAAEMKRLESLHLNLVDSRGTQQAAISQGGAECTC